TRPDVVAARSCVAVARAKDPDSGNGTAHRVTTLPAPRGFAKEVEQTSQRPCCPRRRRNGECQGACPTREAPTFAPLCEGQPHPRYTLPGATRGPARPN